MTGMLPMVTWADAVPVASPMQKQVKLQDAAQPCLNLNGKRINSTAIVEDSGLYLPLRAIGEALGFKVDWLDREQQITLNAPGKSIGLFLKEVKMQVNGHEMYTLGNFKNVNNQTYLAEDFFTDQLGLNIIWDKARGEVTLNSVAQNPIVIENQKEFFETPTLKSTVQYPQLNGLPDSEVQQKLNTLFAGLAAEAKQEGMKNEKDLERDALTRHIKAETYCFCYLI